MNDEPEIEVHRVLPEGGAGTFTAEEANAILEVAYLATAADDDLTEEETSAFRALAGALRRLVGPAAGPPVVDDTELDGLLDGFAAKLEHATAPDRLAALAPALTRSLAKETAYKVSFAMALCDLAESDEEEDFDDELVSALGLSEEAANELASQVYEVIGGDDDEEEDDEDEEDDDLDEDEDADDADESADDAGGPKA